MMRLRDWPRITFGVLPRCRSSRAAEGCDSTDSAEQDTKQLVPRLEVEEMRLRGETKVG